MTSVYGSRATPNRVDYVTTKTALIGLTRSVAIETINQGITCNALCPGAVLTPTSEKRIEALVESTGLDREQATRRFLEGKNPSQRFIEPAHVAQMLVFLCGDAGQDITGAVMPVEGGWLAF
jgi:3-hydroxybutyrate dehydrogenase